MIQFYCPDIESLPVLPESDSNHAVRVLRMHEGDTLQVIDGRGHAFDCRLVAAHPKKAALEIIEKREMPLPWSYDITVAVAPTKSMDRMEWMVEKLTEIGVNRIVPLRCEHSERKEIKTERLEKVAIAAMKQSLKAVLPRIDEITPISDFLAQQLDGQKFIAYCDDIYQRQELACRYTPLGSATILIGPEGDFSPKEITAAIESGFLPITLGPNRLRTETAAIAAVQTCHILSLAAQCDR